jgi:general secretion pathway protein I
MTSHLPKSRVQGRVEGFTLLEVLLAFVVFSISFAVVLQILSGSIRNTMRSKQYTEVALIAQSVMDTVGLDIPLEAGGEASGESGEYTWDLQIYEFEQQEQQQQGQQAGNFEALLIAELTGIELLQIELHVNWGEPPKDRSRRFSTVKAVLAGRRP